MATDGILSSRFARQFGLVRQAAVEDVNVLVVGDGSALTYLLLNLAFCGVGTLQGGVYLADGMVSVADRHLEGQFLLRQRDLGRPLVEALAGALAAYCPGFDLQAWPEDGETRLLPDVVVDIGSEGARGPSVAASHSRRVYGRVGAVSVYVGHEPCDCTVREANALTPALASLGGALLAQEVLRLTNVVRLIGVVDQRVTVAFRLRSPRLQELSALPNEDRYGTDHGVTARLKLGGETLPVSFVGMGDRPDEALFTVSLPEDSLLSRVILDSIELVEEPLDKPGGLLEPTLFSPFGPCAVEDGVLAEPCCSVPAQLDDLAATIVGVGGLGSWVSALLAVTPSAERHLAVVDVDDRVEEHNLNRQVLFTPDDIGYPKAWAAAKALRELCDDAVHAYPVELTEQVVRYVHHDAFEAYEELEWLEDGGSLRCRTSQDRMQAMLCDDMHRSAALISCLDNMATRWVLNVVSKQLGRVFVNGGVGGFNGTADFFDPSTDDASLVFRYGEGVKTDTGKVQCGGAIPIPAIVTTNAVVASIEALLAVGSMAGLRPEANRFFVNCRNRTIWADSLLEPEDSDSVGLAALVAELEDAAG